jgi:hypothetical protein
MAIEKIPLSNEWRRVLEILADAGPGGSANAVLTEQGFSAEMLTSIARAGLATASIDTVWIGGRQIKAPWMRITNAGRFALSARGGNGTVKI